MKPTLDASGATDLIADTNEESCRDCDRTLSRYQAQQRLVQRMDGVFRLTLRDRRCDESCPGLRPILRAPRDLRFVLPGRSYGTDVTLYVGERHLREGISLNRVTKELHGLGVRIDQRHTGRVFRDFLALAALERGDDTTVRARLRAQGGIVLMCDGVQFDGRSPVLYLAWDAISGTPLFGERKVYRGKDDLVPLLERVRAMGVAVIGAVTDKETGLVPAIEQVFPEVPYQYCQTHFLMNCAKPLQPDLTALQQSVQERVEAVRRVGKRLSVSTASALPGPDSHLATPHPDREPAAAAELPPAEFRKVLESSPPSVAELVEPVDAKAESVQAAVSSLSEQDLAQQVCELVRVNGRVRGKAPLDPPELGRHDRLEKLRILVTEARKKPGPQGAGPGTWLLLDKLSEALQPTWHGAQAAGRVRRHTAILRNIAHELSSDPERQHRPKTAAEAQERFDTYLDQLQASAPRHGTGAATGAFIDTLVDRATRYRDHLFVCFDDPRIPATSNPLERFFGVSKRRLRHAIGCASTTNTVVFNLGAEPLLAAHQLQRPDAHDALRNLQPSTAQFWAERARIAQEEAPSVRRRSAVRHLDRNLTQLLRDWLGRTPSTPP